jgi:AraC-like DNA-binding protein
LFCYSWVMPRLVHQDGPAGLERSCKGASRDWIGLAPPQPGLERLEASFAAHGYDPHRHDVYAVGLTLAGVQEFEYRGATVRSLRGQVVVLHPDEMHDGRAGSDAGFRYRMAYIDPALIRAAVGSGRGTLPFVDEAVLDSVRLRSILALALEDLESPLDDLTCDQFVVGLADALCALDRSMPRAKDSAPHRRAVAAARDYLNVNAGRSIGSHELEAVTGLNRYAMARQFRTSFGTSPYRYLTMRRLDRARQLLLAGASLVDAAISSGFADQSHMTRQFKRAYGVSPGRWLRMLTPLPQTAAANPRAGA